MPPEKMESTAPLSLSDDGRMSHQRWVVCALLFAATVIAYVDRGVIANLEPNLQNVIPGLDLRTYGFITATFQTAYALAMFFAGGLTDKLGTRKAFLYAIALWSVAAMLPGAAFSVLSLGIAMFVLGLGEAANFPACIRTVAEWFPKRERTLATSIFNSGANVGNMIVPVLVPWFLTFSNWRGTFVIAGALGLVWLGIWWMYYRRPEEHPGVSPAELAHILSDPGEKLQSVPWSHIFPIKETWGFAAAKFLTDPIWWFYLFWIPPYLRRADTFNLSLNEARMPVVLAYAISIVGSIGAGYVNSLLIDRGVHPNLARKGTMLACVLLIVPIFAVPYVHNLWTVVALLGMATAGHQGWSANLFTVPSDVFPKTAVASVTGFGGMAGAVGGILLQAGAGVIVTYTGSFKTLFLMACLAYPTAMLLLHASTPRLAPAKLK